MFRPEDQLLGIEEWQWSSDLATKQYQAMRIDFVVDRAPIWARSPVHQTPTAYEKAEPHDELNPTMSGLSHIRVAPYIDPCIQK